MKFHISKTLMAPLLTVGLLVVAVVAIPSSAHAACTTWMTVNQSSPTMQDVLFSNDFGGGNACENNTGGTANYTVASQSVAYNGSVLSAPGIENGCEGGYCTYGTALPAAESTVAPTVSWSFNNSGAVSGSEYDEIVDNEFSANCTQTPKPTINANVAVYLGATPSYSKLGLANSSDPTVTVDGMKWYTLQADDNGNYKTEYSAVTPLTGITSLAMAPFYTRLSGNYMPAGECLSDIGVANEIWALGTGLSTSSASLANL
jgi:hypothetical protein